MRKQEDDTYSPIESKYVYYIDNPKELGTYLSSASELDIVAFYKYTIKRIEELKGAKSVELDVYWLVSNKLRATDAVKKYLEGKIKDEDVAEYVSREEKDIQQILDALEKKRKKTPLQKLKSYLKG